MTLSSTGLMNFASIQSSFYVVTSAVLLFSCIAYFFTRYSAGREAARRGLFITLAIGLVFVGVVFGLPLANSIWGYQARLIIPGFCIVGFIGLALWSVSQRMGSGQVVAVFGRSRFTFIFWVLVSGAEIAAGIMQVTRSLTKPTTDWTVAANGLMAVLLGLSFGLLYLPKPKACERGFMYRGSLRKWDKFREFSMKGSLNDGGAATLTLVLRRPRGVANEFSLPVSSEQKATVEHFLEAHIPTAGA